MDQVRASDVAGSGIGTKRGLVTWVVSFAARIMASIRIRNISASIAAPPIDEIVGPAIQACSIWPHIMGIIKGIPSATTTTAKVSRLSMAIPLAPPEFPAPVGLYALPTLSAGVIPVTGMLNFLQVVNSRILSPPLPLRGSELD